MSPTCGTLKASSWFIKNLPPKQTFLVLGATQKSPECHCECQSHCTEPLHIAIWIAPPFCSSLAKTRQKSNISMDKSGSPKRREDHGNHMGVWEYGSFKDLILDVHIVHHPATSKLTLGEVSNWGHILNVDAADVSSRFLCGCVWLTSTVNHSIS